MKLLNIHKEVTNILPVTMIEVYFSILLFRPSFFLSSPPHAPFYLFIFLPKTDGILVLFTVKVASAECFSDCPTLPHKLRKVSAQFGRFIQPESLMLGA